MKPVTYEPGRFAQVKLGDGTRLFVRTVAFGINVRRMVFAMVPTGLVWEYSAPFRIRTHVGGPASGLEKWLLDTVLKHLSYCQTLPEAHGILSRLSQGLERVFEDPARFADDSDVIAAYGETLTRLSAPEAPKRGPLMPESELRHSKERIRAAFDRMIGVTPEAEREEMRVSLMFLDDFAPDAEVPLDLLRNVEAWARKREKDSANAQPLNQTIAPQIAPTPVGTAPRTAIPTWDVFTRLEVDSLRNLSRVLVEFITDRADTDLREWLGQASLKARIETKLRNADLTVVESKEWAKSRLRIPIFRVFIYSYGLSNGAHVYAINVFLQEGVLLLRDRDRDEPSTPLAATWTATNVRYLSSPSVWSKIIEDVDGAVALFVADLQEARRSQYRRSGRIATPGPPARP